MYSGRLGKLYEGQRTLPRQLMPRELSTGADRLGVILREQDVSRKVKIIETNVSRLGCPFGQVWQNDAIFSRLVGISPLMS